MDVIAAYREVGSFRGAAAMCDTTHKTVRRIVEFQLTGKPTPARRRRGRNYDPVAELVAERIAKTSARISAKRLLPAARAASYAGLARNFRRLVAQERRRWRRTHRRGPAAGGYGPPARR